MTKVALADVLWDAANVWLHHSASSQWFDDSVQRGCSFSCHAIQAAVTGHPPRNHFESIGDTIARKFIASLGCDGSVRWSFKFMSDPEELQGIRYMWLLLAMHVAEDEGIEIERGAA